jgi:nucleoside-diphosphate-sugar epimerase
MLKHLDSAGGSSARVVILGAGGFVGSAAARYLARERSPVLGLAHADIDLDESGASAKLAEFLRDDDVLLMAAAKAPVKNNAMLIDNIRMMDAVCGAISRQPVAQIIYISSDAVYADSDQPLVESSCAQPSSLHGIMHLTREVMLRNAWAGPLCLLRPTLLYGAADPHNGYGPNRFFRLAAKGETIILFGEGEERRDHVFIDDVGEIIRRVVRHRSTGILNIATGETASFRAIAELVVSLNSRAVPIKTTSRQGSMPHNGYRPFDAVATREAFPDFTYTKLPDGVRAMHHEGMPKHE